MSSDVHDFDFGAGAGNEEGAECLKEVKRFFKLINKLKEGIYEEAELPIPGSYDKAYEKVLYILYNVIVFLSDPTTKEPHVAHSYN